MNEHREDHLPEPRLDRALLIYVTRSALYGLTDDGAEVLDGLTEDRVTWLNDAILANLRPEEPRPDRPARHAGNDTVLIEYNLEPTLRDRLLHEQPGRRYALPRRGYWEPQGDPRGGLAGFLDWARAHHPAREYALLILGDLLDAGETYEPPANGQARALGSLFSAPAATRPIVKRPPDQGGRPIVKRPPDQGGRPIVKRPPDQGGRPVIKRPPDQGGRPVIKRPPDQGGRPIVKRPPDQGGRPVVKRPPDQGGRPFAAQAAAAAGEHPLNRVQGFESRARVFARARRLLHALAPRPERAFPIELLATDDPTLSYLEVLLELPARVRRVLTQQRALPRATGPLAELLIWLRTGDARDALTEHARAVDRLVCRCEQSLSALSSDDADRAALTREVVEGASSCALVEPAGLKTLQPALEGFARAVASAIERAAPDERESIYARMIQGLRRPVPHSFGCDLLAQITSLLVSTDAEWTPSETLRGAARALQRGLQHQLRDRAQSSSRTTRGLSVYLPVDQGEWVPDEFLELSLLRVADTPQPSRWTRMLSALREISIARALDSAELDAAAARERMRHDMEAFWVRRATRSDTPSAEAAASSDEETRAATGPCAPWGVLLFEVDKPDGGGVDPSSIHEYGPITVAMHTPDFVRYPDSAIDPAPATVDPRGLQRFVRRGVQRCNARHVCLALRIRGGAGLRVLGPPGRHDPLLEGFTIARTANAIRAALKQVARERLDLLILDVPGALTLEAAHEFQDVARRLVVWNTPERPFREHAFLDQLRQDASGESEFFTRAARRAELARPAAPRRVASLRREWDRWLLARAIRAACDEMSVQTDPNAPPASTDPFATALNLETIDVLSRRVDVLCKLLFNHLDDPVIWPVLRRALTGLADDQPFELAAIVGAAPPDPRGDAPSHEARGRPLREFLDELEHQLADHRGGQLLKRIRSAITRAREALREQLNGHGDELRVHLPLDGQLNEPEYLELRFHQDVHLYSLLTATRLILNSRPHQLWDMVRAALSYTSGAQRGALLQRLANFETAVPTVAVLDERGAPLGPEETRAALRGDEERPHATHHAQFASLASPPLLTLSLEPDSPYNLSRGAAAVTLDDDDLRYRVRLSSSESNATLPQRLRRVNPRAIEDALSGLDSLLRSAAASDAEWHYLESMGVSLGEDIIGDLKRPLELMRAELERESPGRLIHLALQIPRELMRYPWELMSDGELLLSQRFAIGRQVWTDSTRVIPPEQRDTDPLRVLIVGDPRLHPPYPASAQLAGARAEAEEVAALFEELSREFGPAMDFRRDRDVFIHTTLTRAAMRRLLRDRGYDIVHFAGHGVFSPNHPERSAWLLSDGPLWASELRNTFAWSDSPPWLIYANACDAGMSSDAPSSLYTGDVFGLATACINQGVEAYVAPLWPIADEPGRLFATSFYRELMLRRSTLGVALHTARAATERACRAKATTGFGLFDISWASMVLYGEPGARLIDALGGEL